MYTIDQFKHEWLVTTNKEILNDPLMKRFNKGEK